MCVDSTVTKALFIYSLWIWSGARRPFFFSSVKLRKKRIRRGRPDVLAVVWQAQTGRSGWSGNPEQVWPAGHRTVAALRSSHAHHVPAAGHRRLRCARRASASCSHRQVCRAAHRHPLDAPTPCMHACLVRSLLRRG